MLPFFFFNDTATTEIYTLSLHDALPIFSGTRFMEILTGQVYALTGPTRLGGFKGFSWFSFLGGYPFYRAFRDRKSTRLNSTHPATSYSALCSTKKTYTRTTRLTYSRTSS